MMLFVIASCIIIAVFFIYKYLKRRKHFPTYVIRVYYKNGDYYDIIRKTKAPDIPRPKEFDKFLKWWHEEHSLEIMWKSNDTYEKFERKTIKQVEYIIR